MKKFKFYVSMILALSIMASVCTGVLASEIVEYNISWILKPSEGVQGYVYDSSAYGFIVKDSGYETNTMPTTALIDDKGIVLPPSERMFDYVGEGGYIEYGTYDSSGVMDIEGKTIIPEYSYNVMYMLDADHYLCVEKSDDTDWNNYKWGIVDAEGNIIVPYGEYPVYYYNGTINVYNDEYKQALIDYDGNILVGFDEGADMIFTLPAKDRYIIKFENDDKFYLRHIDGTIIASFDYQPYYRPTNCLEVSKYDMDTDTAHYWYYDLDGNLIKEQDNNPLPDLNFVVNNEKYFMATDENYKFYVSDREDNVIYTNPDLNVFDVFADKFVYAYDSSYEKVTLLDIEGNTVIPFGQYDKISYCEELDIYAFEKDGKVSVGRITPITVMVDGAKLEFDQNPVAINGRTLLPLRAVFDALGASVDWDQATQTVTSRRGDIEVKVTIGSDKMYVNGVEKILDVPAQALNNRSLVPVRAVGEAFECNVGWDGATFTVNITK